MSTSVGADCHRSQNVHSPGREEWVVPLGKLEGFNIGLVTFVDLFPVREVLVYVN